MEKRSAKLNPARVGTERHARKRQQCRRHKAPRRKKQKSTLRVSFPSTYVVGACTRAWICHVVAQTHISPVNTHIAESRTGWGSSRGHVTLATVHEVAAQSPGGVQYELEPMRPDAGLICQQRHNRIRGPRFSCINYPHGLELCAQCEFEVYEGLYKQCLT